MYLAKENLSLDEKYKKGDNQRSVWPCCHSEVYVS